MTNFEYPVLRDYLYVDAPRVRSLLAQIEHGVPVEAVSEDRSTSHDSLSGDLKVIKASRGQDAAVSLWETRSLADRLFAAFEDAAESTQFLTDISDIAADESNWLDSSLHRMAAEGSIIRLTAPSQLVDSQHWSTVLDRMADAFMALEEISELTTADDSSASNSNNTKSGKKNTKAKVRQKDPVAAREAVTLGTGINIGTIKQLMQSFYPDISVRSYPCGRDNSKNVVSGTLVASSDYLADQRSMLFSRYGSGMYEWTIVGIVTRNGSSDALASTQLDVEESEANVVAHETADEPVFDRQQFEALAQSMIGYVEQTGLTEGPVPGGITIVPLGVYRVITAPDPSVAEGAQL